MCVCVCVCVWLGWPDRLGGYGTGGGQAVAINRAWRSTNVIHQAQRAPHTYTLSPPPNPLPVSPRSARSSGPAFLVRCPVTPSPNELRPRRGTARCWAATTRPALKRGGGGGVVVVGCAWLTAEILHDGGRGGGGGSSSENGGCPTGARRGRPAACGSLRRRCGARCGGDSCRAARMTMRPRLPPSGQHFPLVGDFVVASACACSARQ